MLILKKAILTSFVLLSYIGNTSAQGENSSKYFDGLYFGVSIGSQNIFGGAYIDDLDLLAQKNGFVLEFYPGFRKQIFDDRMMIGFELQFGFTDGGLTTNDPRYEWEVSYENNFQSGYGLSAGVVLGAKKNTLVYTYGKLTNRSFNISFTEDTGFTHHQEDGQRFLRYGLSIERQIREKLNVSLIIGGVYVDFGNLVTSQEVNDALDVNLALTYQF